MNVTSIDEKAIFNAARMIGAADARDAYLSRSCAGDTELEARIRAQLRAYEESPSFLESPLAHVAKPTLAMTVVHPFVEALGTSIGPYKLREVLGEGGMGIVYAAEQEQPIRRRVALKVIKPGMDSKEIIGRFSAERQALALMDHPNIAKVLDAGTTESGRPYFVMEFVRGLPITEYCDRAKLPLRERLKLFITVCQAIQHAHQKGIIHRDLKPSNVMITLHDGTPVPKVIDFGVAKALNQRLTEQTVYTRAASLVGTPMYMSPEQAELSGLDVDTRSDVYALGTLLYELLTGQTPFDKARLSKAGYDELRRIIREDEPPRPSQRINTLTAADSTTVSAQRGIDARKLQSTLHGELDWIVMKALEKDRNRRYESASAFAADVERFLDDQPVQACPPSASYRLRKIVRKNRILLTTATVVAVALMGGTAVSVWQAMEAISARKLADDRLDLANERLKRETEALEETKVQRRLAEENFQTALNAVEQMTRAAEEDLARLRDVEPVRRQLLEDSLKFYEQFLEKRGNDSEMRFQVAKAWQRVGLIRHLLMDWDGALTALEKAISIVEGLLRDSPDDIRCVELLAESLAKHGVALMLTGRYTQGETGPWSQGAKVLHRGLATYRHLQKLGTNKLEHRRIVAEIQMMLGENANQKGDRSPEAIAHLWDAIRTQRDLLAEDGQKWGDRARLMFSLIILAQFYDFEQANQLLDEAEALGEDLPTSEELGAPEGQFDDPINALATVYAFRAKFQFAFNRGTLAEQEVNMRRAMSLLDPHLAAYPEGAQIRQMWVSCRLNYADILATAGRTDEAERLHYEVCHEALAHYRIDLHYYVMYSLERWKDLLDRSGRNDDQVLVEMRHKYYAKLDQPQFQKRIDASILKRRAKYRFDAGRFSEALEDLSAAAKEQPDDTSILFCIPPASVAACPDEDFRRGILALADETIQRTSGSDAAYTARAKLHQAIGHVSAAADEPADAAAAIGSQF